MLTTLFLIGAAVVGAGEPLAQALPPEELVRMLRRARIAGVRHRPDEQKSTLEEALRRFPDQPTGYLALVDFYEEHPAPPEEVRRLRAAMRPLLEQGEHEVPVGFLKLLFEDPRTPPEDLELLRAHLVARLERAPADTVLLRLLAQLRQRAGDLEAARELNLRLLAVHPDPWARRDCIDIDLRLGRWDEALALIQAESGQGVDPQLVIATLRALIGAGKVDELEKELTAAQGDPSVAARLPLEPLVESGWRLVDQDRNAEAERLFRRLLAMRPEDDGLQRIVFELFASTDERQAAEKTAAERLTRASPGQLLSEGSVLLVAGDAAGAFDVLSRAVHERPDSATAWSDLGLAARKLKRWDDAEQAFDRALQIRSDASQALVGRGEARLRLGKFAAALADLREAERLKPDQKDTWALLVECFKAMGDSRAAQAASEHLGKLP